MLIEFRVENYRSLRDEQVFSMEAGLPDDPATPCIRAAAGYSESLLPVAVLYGANASGKTNVLNALIYMQEAVFRSSRHWEPDQGVPREPFAWGSKKDEPSLFEIKLVLDGTRYEYGFQATNERFSEEWLFAWPNNKKQTWFERDGDKFKFGEHLKGRNNVIEEVTRPNSLFLSAAVQLGHVQLQPIFSWFRSLRPLNFVRRNSPSVFWGSPYVDRMAADLFAAERQSAPGTGSGTIDETAAESLRDRFRALLKSADIGITDVRVETIEMTEKHRRRRIELKHESSVDDAWLPLEQESQGTQTLFGMALPMLEVLEKGGALVVDELEGSLHPTLAWEIVKRFNDPCTNPHNAQLLFTTHDTNLLGTTLGKPALRRDQVWLTEKDDDGATVVYPLTDFMPRKAENMERGYLQGRYGAIPFLGDFAMSAE